jgi:uncharacterized protein GlcG (DUF336 family)
MNADIMHKKAAMSVVEPTERALQLRFQPTHLLLDQLHPRTLLLPPRPLPALHVWTVVGGSLLLQSQVIAGIGVLGGA